jgi:hypothetical protein
MLKQEGPHAGPGGARPFIDCASELAEPLSKGTVVAMSAHGTELPSALGPWTGLVRKETYTARVSFDHFVYPMLTIKPGHD